MRTSDAKAIGALPRNWSDRLFAAMLTGYRQTLWNAVAEIVLEALPEDVLVAWETFDTIGFRRSSDGGVEMLRGPDVHQLRAGTIYNALSVGYDFETKSISDDQLSATGIVDARLVNNLRPLNAVAIDFLHDTSVREAQASLVCYGRAEAGCARRRIIATLQPVVGRCVAALVERRRLVAKGTGLAALLRDVPVGLILVEWFGTPLAVNKEGYRQAAAWNDAPSRPNLKQARRRFAVHSDLVRGREELQGAWIDWLRGDAAQPTSLTVCHGSDPSLEATVEVINDQDGPNTAPCFLMRFASVHARGRKQQLVPSVRQVAILSSLSPAERSVALLVQAGLSNKEIADQLARQIGTIKDHLTNIYIKLGIARRTQLSMLLHES